MKKTIGIIFVLIVTLIALTGCVNLDYEVKINSNGSGDVSYVYGFTKDTLKSLQQSADQLVKTQREQAEKNGYKTEDYKDDEIEGFKATKHLKDITQEFSIEEFGEDYIDEEKAEITVDKSFFKTEIKQKVEVDLTQISDVQLAVNVKYTVKTPVKIRTNNATEVTNNGRTATWNLKPGEINNIEFTASGINANLIIVILVLLIVAGAVYFYFFFKKKAGTKK